MIIDEAENERNAMLEEARAQSDAMVDRDGVGMLSYVGRRTPRLGASAAPTKKRRVRRTNLGGGDR